MNGYLKKACVKKCLEDFLKGGKQTFLFQPVRITTRGMAALMDRRQVRTPGMQNGKVHHARRKVAEECTTAADEDINPEDPKVTVYRSEKNEKDRLFMIDHTDCLSKGCSGRLDTIEQTLAKLQKENDERNQERAELLLRSLATDIERTACWVYMRRKGSPPKDEWIHYSSAMSLLDINGYTWDDVWEVRSLIAKWWKPKNWHEQMSHDEIKNCLRTFWKERLPGNAVAHPLFPVVHEYDKLLKIALKARGRTRHKKAWNLFLSWEMMQREKDIVIEEDRKSGKQDISETDIFETEDEKNRDKSKEASMLASLTDVELPTKDLEIFLKKLSALML